MYLVQILLPRADNSGRLFDREDFDRRFEGVTAYLQAPAEGLRREGRQSGNDDIVIFEVMTETMDLPDWRTDAPNLNDAFDRTK